MGIIKPNSFILPAATSATLGGVKADPATDKDITPCRIKNGKLYITPPDSGQTFVLKAATLAALGGIKAGPKTEADTVVAHIGEDQQLYVPAPVVPNMPHVQVVSYVGTGTTTNSQNNHLTIQVDFPIKSIFILGYSYLTEGSPFFVDVFYISNHKTTQANVTNIPKKYTISYGLYLQNRNVKNYGKVSEDAKTYSWYGQNDETGLNDLGVTYYFLVIG